MVQRVDRSFSLSRRYVEWDESWATGLGGLNEKFSGMRRVSLSHIPRRTDNNAEALLRELAASRGSLETLGGLRDPRTTAAKW